MRGRRGAVGRTQARNCGRKPREDENPDDDSRTGSDGIGELHVFCPECWEREFAELPTLDDMGEKETDQTGVETASPEWLVQGFYRALRRLNATISKGDVEPMETFIPLFETLHWVVAAKVESRLKGRDEWELARAIRFARNRVNHQWAQALSLQDKPFPTIQTNLTTGSRVYSPPVVKMWCWLPAERLPVPEEPKYLDEEGEPLYREHLAGHLALEALDAIAVALAAKL